MQDIKKNKKALVEDITSLVENLSLGAVKSKEPLHYQLLKYNTYQLPYVVIKFSRSKINWKTTIYMKVTFLYSMIIVLLKF